LTIPLRIIHFACPWIELVENYNSFILTIGYISVGIYCIGDGGFKIFDSHARDLYGMSHPQGTSARGGTPFVQVVGVIGGPLGLNIFPVCTF